MDETIYSDDIKFGDVMTVEAFRDACKRGAFIDYDGDGSPAKDGKTNLRISISPSNLDAIPPDATHIVWYNK